MKKQYFNLVLVIALVFVAHILLAQAPPPNPPVDPNSGGGPVGGSGSIDGGIGFLIGLATALGGYKIHQLRKKKAIDNN